MSKKQKKIFKIIITILVVLLVIELIFFAFRYYQNRKNSTFYSISNSIILTDSGYIGAGFSDYRHSKFNDYKDGYNKATIFVNENGKITNEIGLNLGNNSYYNDIIKTKDGYIAVGKIEMTKSQTEEKLSEGLIVKYDKDFNIVWRRNVSILDKTELLKVKLDSDNNIIIVGSSIYGDGYVGNHTTGGGILLKYNQKGKRLLKINNGGPYSGTFNDVLLLKDGYVVVGLGKANSGIIIKYNLKGKEVWTNSYGATDKNGITSIIKVKDKFLTTTTKVIDTKDLSEYSAAIVKFDENGKKIDDVKYSSDKITYFSDIIKDDDNNLYACGYTGKLVDGILKGDAIIVKYDKDLYQEEENILKGDNNETYSNMTIKNKKIIAFGYSNSKLDIKALNGKLNGYDYFDISKEYNLDLK